MRRSGLPPLKGDDGTLAYARAAGVYLDGVDAPLSDDRIVPSSVALQRGVLVILTFGQSNAANMGEGHYTPKGPVYAFNVFDMQYYVAADPIPGASGDGGAVWGRLGDKLVNANFARSVIFVPIAMGATFIQDWLPGGPFCRRLQLAIHRLRLAGLNIDCLCWQQGEAEANHTNMSAKDYSMHFGSLLGVLRYWGVTAPIYAAVATLCEHGEHPCQNRVEIRRAQKELVSPHRRVWSGPDTDRIGPDHRLDGCHFSKSGLALCAQAWFDALTCPLSVRLSLWAKHRLLALRGKDRGDLSLESIPDHG